MNMPKSPFSSIPFSEIERVGARRCLYQNFFNTTWVLGAFCNYKCSYCWPYAHSSIRDYFPLEILLKTIDKIKKAARQRGYNSFNWTFHGGEPCVYKGYMDMVHHISKDTVNCEQQTIHMTSNLSPSLKWLKKWVDTVTPLSYTTVIGSFHNEFAKREIFADKVLFLQEQKNISIVARIVMVPSRFETLWEDALYFYNKGINVSLMPQKDNAQKVVSGYTDSMLERLQNGLPRKHSVGESKSAKLSSSLNAKQTAEKMDNNRVEKQKHHHYTLELKSVPNTYWIDEPERLNSLRFNQFKGWECSTGYGACVIERNGDVRRGHMCHDKILGNIQTDFELYSKPQVCVTPRSCSTGADIEIPKRKMGSFLPLWENP